MTVSKIKPPKPSASPLSSSPNRGEVGRGALSAHTYPHPNIKEFARELRKNTTNAEELLWKFLRGKQLGAKFRRQHPLGPYVADFISLKHKLIVELDGSQHGDENIARKDNERTEFLKSQGFQVLRFWNNELFENTEAVMQTIYDKIQSSQACPHPSPPPMGEGILDALPLLVALIGPGNELIPANKAGQEFWGGRVKKLTPHFAQLADRVRASGELITMHDMTLERHLEEYRGTVHCQPHGKDHLLLTVDVKGSPHAPGASAWKQEITAAAGVMAAMMAHEVKNPLSSIRGAAQLLRDTASEAERPLADLICNETLRIRDLLDQVEIFSDERSVELVALNIHEVLQYSMRVAQAGFAGHVKFIERYDPSLPPVLSHRDLLVQMFLNIIKNASEALACVKDATITLTTSYQSGLKMTEKKLPITVNISDNGQGIPVEIRKKLFEPLVSSKAQGRGLGLAVVAKIASDLGVIVECDDPPTQAGASFTIHLPVG